jgi:hypothetical protein
LAYTEILQPETYVADPGGEDFQIVGNGRANTNPGLAVSAMLANDSADPYAPDLAHAAHAYFGPNDYGNGRFVMTNHTINGIVQKVAARGLFLPRFDGAGTWWTRLWTHGAMYENGGNYIGQSSYPPGTGWRIHESVYVNNPFTGAAWTLTELDDLHGGFRLYFPFLGPFCDQIYVLVTYSAVPPTVATNSASGILPAQATLNGYLTDDGAQLCTLFFEWGATPALGNIAAGVPPNGNTGSAFSAVIAPLIPGQTYWFRAGATNLRGSTYGATLTFSTAPVPFAGGIYCSKVLMELL